MIFRILITLGFLGLLLYVVSHTINPGELWQTLSTFPIHWFFILLVIALLINLLRAWRFAILLKNNRIKLSRWEVVRVYIAGLSTSMIPAGSAVRGILIHHETGAQASRITSSIITQGYLELFASALIALIGSTFFRMIELPSAAAFSILLVVGLLLSSHRISEALFRLLPKLSFLTKFIRKARLIHKNVRSNFLDQETKLPDRVFTTTLGLSLLTNVIGGILVVLIAINFDIRLNVIESIFIYSATILIQGFSISPGGLGFTEGGMAGLLYLFGVDFTTAIYIIIIFRLVTLIYSTLLGIIFFVVFYGKKLVRGKVFRNYPNEYNQNKN